MALYTADGVFMAQHFPTAVGTQAVQNAYDTVSRRRIRHGRKSRRTEKEKKKGKILPECRQ
jgi:hypothetical protein